MNFYEKKIMQLKIEYRIFEIVRSSGEIRTYFLRFGLRNLQKGLWCFPYIVAVSFIVGGNQNTRRKSPRHFASH